MRCNGVFEGGGVRGIGLAGAFSVLEEHGCEFRNVAGSSAGAIIAALIAVGYNGGEIKSILRDMDFSKFRDARGLAKFGGFGKAVNMWMRLGVYKTAFFEEWMQALLSGKGLIYFGDIKTGEEEKYRYRFQAVASDLTENRLLVLPRDLEKFGYNPDKFPIARAVTMSMSIPIYFEPYRLVDQRGREHIIVDGGLLSNYPLWLLDGGDPEVPTYGFKFSNSKHHAKTKDIGGLVEFSKSVIETMMDAHDNYYIDKDSGEVERTIFIPTIIDDGKSQKPIKSTDFDINRDEALLLYQNGRNAAEKFLSRWSFTEWKNRYLQGAACRR